MAQAATQRGSLAPRRGSVRRARWRTRSESDGINEARAVRVTRIYRKGALWSFAPHWGAFLPTPGTVPSGTIGTPVHVHVEALP